MKGHLLHAIVIVLFALTPACRSTSDKLTARFARENGCAQDQVQVVSSGATTYRANGCGKSAEYVCPSFVGDDARSCEEPGAQKKPGGDPPPLPNAYTPPHPPGPLPK